MIAVVTDPRQSLVRVCWLTMVLHRLNPLEFGHIQRNRAIHLSLVTPFTSTFSLHARQLALAVFELLPDCQTLNAMLEIWRHQLNRDIPGLHAALTNRRQDSLCSCVAVSPCETGITGEIGQACKGPHELF